MRKIIFRGKRIRPEGVDDAWAYGSLIQRIDTTEIHDGVFTWNIHPDTIGQFTGLTDKNGKDIYEGDIWKDTDGMLFQIDYAEGEFAGYKYGYYRKAGLLKFGEVVGNIHDNPELLTSK